MIDSRILIEGSLWIIMSLLIVISTRTVQYITKGFKFIILHSFIDILVIANPLSIAISPLFILKGNIYDNITIIQTLIYVITICAYIYYKRKYFIINKITLGNHFPYLDIIIIVICIFSFSIFRLY